MVVRRHDVNGDLGHAQICLPLEASRVIAGQVASGVVGAGEDEQLCPLAYLVGRAFGEDLGIVDLEGESPEELANRGRRSEPALRGWCGGCHR